jgi:hypothetical protein
MVITPSERATHQIEGWKLMIPLEWDEPGKVFTRRT